MSRSILLAVIHAERERSAEEEPPDVTHDDAENESEPVHPGTAPSEDEGTEEITVEILEGWIGL